MYSTAFKAYDIRGLWGDEIDMPFGYVMGIAMGKHINEMGLTDDRGILIGADTRGANDGLVAAFIAGLESVGCHQYHVAGFTPAVAHPSGQMLRRGVCSTSMTYYLGQHDYAIGVSVSASHNPAQYVGMKFFDREVGLFPTTMLKQRFDEAYASLDSLPSNDELAQYKPTLNPFRDMAFLTDKKQQLFASLQSQFAQLSKYHHRVVDYSTGAGVSLEREFLQQLGGSHRVHHQCDYPDGSFPEHESDTQEVHSYDKLIARVREEGAEFGVMFDGDADRIGFVDEYGTIIRGDTITAIISRQILADTHACAGREPKILYDVMSSKIIADVCHEQGAIPVVTRMGRYFINHELKACNGVFAGECSAHYLFASIGGYEMPLLALYYVMKELEKHNSFSAMIAPYMRYVKPPMLNLNYEDKDGLIERIKDHFADYQPQQIDGVNIFADDFSITVRKSNTTPIIRISIEAKTSELYTQLRGQIEGLM